MSLLKLLSTVALGFACTAHASAQCAEWSTGFAAPSTPLGSDAHAFAIFDDGAGPKIYSGTSTSNITSGAAGVWRWTGSRWERMYTVSSSSYVVRKLVSTIDASVSVLLVIETPANTLSNNSSRIWRFDGSTWTQLGQPDFRVLDLDYLDDGVGTYLFACGDSNSPSTGRVAWWEGTQWIDVGSPLPKVLFSITAVRFGATSQLYVCGPTNLLGGSSMATWDGTTWSGVAGINETISTLASFDDGNGENLYAGLPNGSAPHLNFRRFDGASWSVAAPLAGTVYSLQVAALPTPRLLVGGSFTSPSPTHGLYEFDGTNATAVGSNALTLCTESGASFDGTERHVYASGTSSSGKFMNVAEWTPSTDWQTLGRGFFASTSQRSVYGFTRFDFGAGTELVAIGQIYGAGYGDSNSFGGIAHWNGDHWATLGASARLSFGNPSDAPITLEVADFGAGPELYAGGYWLQDIQNRGLVRWSGTSWVRPIAAEFGNVLALRAFDDGNGMRLFVGGQFDVGAPGNNVFAWDGTSGVALDTGMNNIVSAFGTFDEGSGERLFAGGIFTTAGSTSAQRIARWNGSAWSAVGTGIPNGGVNAMLAFAGQLYVAGTFTSAGAVPASSIARWDGTTWSALPGGGANGAVLALCVHDDGRGPALYVGGGFDTIGGITAYNIARFDGTSWEAVDGGLNSVVDALASHDDDGDGDNELFVGGKFNATATFETASFARLEGCPHYTAFCFSDGTFADHTTACPCGNNGAPGNGCAHSFDAGGANLSATGSTFQDTVVLRSQFEPVSSFTLFLQQANQGDAVFHDGVLCAANPLVRIRGRGAVGGEAFFPNSNFAQDSTTSLSQRGGVTIGSGVTRYYSAFYRNASTSFCPPATANVTNGVRVVW